MKRQRTIIKIITPLVDTFTYESISKILADVVICLEGVIRNPPLQHYFTSDSEGMEFYLNSSLNVQELPFNSEISFTSYLKSR